jgi:glutamate synthase (NADPH/NADH) small chain
MVLLALGFEHPVLEGLITELGLELDGRKNVKVNDSMITSNPKVFAAGDTIMGASLVVNAIASGRRAAKEIARFLKNLS